MIDYSPLYFLIFLIVSATLIIASINDYKSRKVPVNIWKFAVYIALPLSFIPLVNQIWDGNINVNNPLQTFFVVYPLFIIGILFIISSYTKIVAIGGADFIAITIILITSIPMGLSLPIVYMAIFLLFSIISVVMTYLIKKEGFKIPLIIPISFAYFIAVPLYFILGANAFSLI